MFILRVIQQSFVDMENMFDLLKESQEVVLTYLFITQLISLSTIHIFKKFR